MKRTFSRRASLVVLVAAAVAAVAATAAASDAATSARGRSAAAPRFEVLAVLPLSGPGGYVGALAGRALAAAAGTINHSGGILGRQVGLKIVDDGGDGNRAISEVQQELGSGTRYGLVVAGAFTSEALPLAAALAKTPILQMSFSASDQLNDPATYPFHYGTVEGFVPNAVGLVDKIKKDHISKIAIVCGDNAGGHSGATALQTAAKDAGLTVTATVFVPTSAADATPQVQQAQASAPQALAMIANTPATATVIAARAKLGWSVPFYGDATVASVQWGQIATPAALQGVKVQTFPYLVSGNAATKTPAYRAFLKGLAKYDAHPSATLFIATTSWDQLMLVRAAALKAHSVDSATLARTMPTLHSSSQVPGWIGSRSIYSATSHFPTVGNGDFIYVTPGPLVDGLMVPGR